MEYIKTFDEFIKEEFNQNINEESSLEDDRGHIINIEKETEMNDDYRRVLYTASKLQLVVMSLNPGEEIGSEVHDDGDQFIRVEKGKALVSLNDEEFEVSEDFSIVIPSGVEHNIINSGEEDLKLYVIYAPAEHEEGTIEPDKQ